MNILKEKSVDFISQHTFDECRLKNKLPFDFYLPEINLCIKLLRISYIDFDNIEDILNNYF